MFQLLQWRRMAYFSGEFCLGSCLAVAKVHLFLFDIFAASFHFDLKSFWKQHVVLNSQSLEMVCSAYISLGYSRCANVS